MGGVPDFNKFISGIKNIGSGITEIFDGIGQEFVAVGQSVELGVIDIFTLIEYYYIFLGSYIGCAIYFLINIRGCLFYYLLEVLGQILYIPIRITIWIFSLMHINLQKYFDKFWNKMEKFDQMIYKNAKFHIIHYPRGVRQLCYVCKRLKTKALVDKSNVIKDDFSPGGRIQQFFDVGINMIAEGADKVTHPFG